MRMKMLVAAGMVAGTVLWSLQSVSATEILRFDGYYAGGGGEFTVFEAGHLANYDADATKAHPDDGDRVGFQTFCLELNETLTRFPTGYTIDDYAVEGGKGGGSPDPLSLGTAWLYLQFAHGDLSGYEYTPGDPREDDAVALQEAIWWLENEISLKHPENNEFIGLAMGEFSVSAEDLRANNDGQVKGVAVMNFYKSVVSTDQGVEQRQSMPVLVPDGGLTLALVGMGVLGCAALRRRMTK